MCSKFVRPARETVVPRISRPTYKVSGEGVNMFSSSETVEMLGLPMLYKQNNLCEGKR